MKYINENMTILEICNNYPETIEFLTSKGFKNLDNQTVRNTIGKVTLKNALALKKINAETFVEILNEFISQNRDSADITMNKKETKEKSENEITMTGLLPCPIRIPMLEGMKKFLENNKDIDLNYDLKAASYGLDWLKDDVIKANHPEKLADIFISAGFDLFFEDELMGKFKKENIFKDITGIKEYNKDFNNELISLKDPEGDYSMLGVVPAVFLVNKDELRGREIPKTWEDLLKPEFEKSVSLPISDFDLFNSILINLYKKYGKEAVTKLGKSLLQNLHPSQMVKSDKFKENVPAVTIMPYFFTKMIKDNSSMTAVWPEDGAAISPIFMLTKKDKEDKLKKVAEFLSGKEIGTIMSHQGLFPTVNPEVDNNIEGKKFLWVGWDYIHKNNIGEILRECKELFFKGAEEVK